MKFNSFSFTHPGHQRKINEDAYYSNDEMGLWIVCDGMGGHEDGNFASHLVTDTFESLSFEGEFNTSVEKIIKTVHYIKTKLDKKVNQTSKKAIIGTTLILLYIKKDKAICIHAGDSRCYNLRDNKLSLVTVDHSRELIQNNSSRKVLTNALFAPGDISIETKKFRVKQNDTFLLCSDGLYDKVNNNLLKEAMGEKDFCFAMKRLSQHILANEADDNITGILVGIQ